MASSATSAPTNHLLASLPARPPTPPREAGHDVDVSLKSVLGRTQPLDPRQNLLTPPSALSPVSVATGSDVSSNRATKKVEWSSHTDYKDPPDYRDGARLEKSPPLSSAPSSAASKPIKGILKPSSSPGLACSTLSIDLDGAISYPNLIEMLESAVKQLAGSDRDSKLDAYMTLARALKASNNLPDRVALQSKMSLFVQFIQRDVTSRNDNGSLDSSLANHALHLLITFLHFQAIASTIPYDFSIFIIDYAIRSFENRLMPKDVIRHLMQVVAFQNFPTKLMTSDRVGRLIAALHKIEEFFQGKSIVMSRLHIYKRLVKQARGFMVLHSEWLKDMFMDMLSMIKDIRNQAIALGTEAGFALRADKQLFRKAADVFKATNGEALFIDFYIQRLQRMIKDKQAAVSMPQIWSVVILFLRCPLDRWDFYVRWMTLVQNAFNATDSLVKREANYAWTRYASLSIIHGRATQKTVDTLLQPLLSQLRRKTTHEEASKLRKAVMGGVCSLYYHMLAQNNEKYSNDFIWDAAVQPFVIPLTTVDSFEDCMMQAVRILVGLLDVSTPRPSWNPNRIMDSTPLTPEDLLPIDSKWVRRNCERVFQTVGPVLEKRFTDLANKDSLVYRLWLSFVGSVAAASAKDIKMSEDTTKFLACTLDLLAKHWAKGCAEDGDSARRRFSTSVKHFIQLLPDGLGVLPFTEKKQSTSPTFETAATFLQRAGKGERASGVSWTPLQHLFLELSSVPSGFTDNEELADLFRSLFEPFLQGRTSRARAELARELIQLLPQNTLSPYGPWLLAAESMKLYLERSATDSGANFEKSLGPEYREMISLLDRGLTYHPSLPPIHWEQFFDAVSASVLKEFGDAGRALVVVEPLAKSILDNGLCSSTVPSDMSIRAMTMIFGAANLPQDRKTLDDARSRLWGAPLAAIQGTPSDPFDNVYKLANLVMSTLYENLADVDSHIEIEKLIESVVSFFERCWSVSLVKSIAKLQHALCPWIQDEKSQLRLREGSSISATLSRMCERLVIELSCERLARKDFDQVEALLIAALRSNIHPIANKAMEACSVLFKKEALVECSDKLKAVYLSLRPEEDHDETEDGQSSQAFDAQVHTGMSRAEDDSIIVVSPAISKPASTQSPSPRSSGSKRHKAMKRKMQVTNDEEEKPTKNRNPSRLRHDNSQIQFAPIAPSSPSNDESQHLTRRQKEVQERQRETAALYSDHGAGTSEAAPQASTNEDKSKASQHLARDITPDRATSFNDLLRSTPTPRRGQVLPMDDANDPPSSPPVPRPCPLLSEIQSRSRVHDMLQSWEFSSPTGSPVRKSEQAGQEGEPPLSPKACTASPSRARVRTRSQRLAKKTNGETESTIVVDVISSMESSPAKVDIAPAPTDPPTTPPRRCLPPHDQTPGSGDDEDEFTDARSSPELPALGPQVVIGGNTDGRQDAKAISSSPSEVDEQGMVELVIELESRPHDLPSSEADNSPKSDLSCEDDAKRAQALQETPTGPKTRRESLRLASLATTCREPQANGEAKRKRKRGETQQAEGDGKRRRPTENKGHAKKDERRDASPPPPAIRTRMETRGSIRKQKQAPADASAVKKGAKDRRCRDKRHAKTDEEPASSLATPEQSEFQASPKRWTRRKGDKAAETKPDEEGGLGEEGERGDDGTTNIMGTLRNGLEQLRKVALDRDRVYELEDVLMDMKRELYEAEKRGRTGKVDGRTRSARA
ncbi:hypothetical protein L249_4577 [Ophiocordyceps polyrhachis-furcata BCC 54312]|uniref:Telomere-associated protein Rif1 N-terminal domain-containing protein n=1 Tax=Ophiocordyceps polyrhachis-furcata BCC 54312 TaxID=1330021 RepID=A0A367LBZ6_9HYPO|nr:hypothetical protein L249_4577 [Ophiocordyceps polyrhachis-furcata BCC 54312]